MIITTTDQIEGKRVVEVKGLVQGNTIRARNVGRDIMAGFRNIIGGRDRRVHEPDDGGARSGERTDGRLRPREVGANAIVGMHFVTSMVLAGASELLAYGTAVVVEDAG